jgi:glutathione S-transferase
MQQPTIVASRRPRRADRPLQGCGDERSRFAARCKLARGLFNRTRTTTMDKMTLYYSPTSPYVRKVMICAHELGLADRLELHPEKVTPVTPSADYARRNPLMKVPALGLADGRTLIDSAVICEYLDSLAGHRFFPAGDARWNALRLQAVAQGAMDAGVLARYEANLRPEPLRWAEWSAGQFAKVDNALDALEQESSSWRDTFHIGQVTVCCALGFLDFRLPERPWRSSRPRLARWWEQTGMRDSVQRTAPR